MPKGIYKRTHKPWNKGIPFKHNGRYFSGMKGKKHKESSKKLVSEKLVGRKITWGNKISAKRTGKCLGDKNPSWMGGKSFEKYGSDWKESLKESIKLRDKYTCISCKINEDLVVHHIDKNKKNCNPENLITMCRKCHSVLHNKDRKKADLRKQFFDTLLNEAKKDEKIILLVCDLGFSFYEKFKEELPNQIMNTGISEQNSIGVAAGLALGGFKPYVYSGSVFLIARPYEFIRDEVAYNNLNVKLIGTGASGFLGFSHNWLGKENEEDLLKNLPNLKRHFPQTEEELIKILTSKHNGPEYIRL